jgi:hypothetical protein
MGLMSLFRAWSAQGEPLPASCQGLLLSRSVA